MRKNQKSRRQIVLRRRSIFESIGAILVIAGFTCLFLFCSVKDGYDLPYPLAIVGVVLSVIGALMINFIENIKQEEEEYLRRLRKERRLFN